MAWKTRDDIRRKLRQSKHNLDTVLATLLEIKTIYEQTGNQQYADAIEAIMRVISIAADEIETTHMIV